MTGHTGFKGSWLCIWLEMLGARVSGFALDPPTVPSLFECTNLRSRLSRSVTGDVRDFAALRSAVEVARPEIVFHLAAQPLVTESYRDPVSTYSTNVLGTVHVLEAVRTSASVRCVVNVTTDKVYENSEWVWAYRENDRLGGYDPYSSSKACSELVTSAYRDSYFNAASYDRHHVAIATARSGNVVGGGDWAQDRLIPDSIRAFAKGEPLRIRSPEATRPWQHVLEPLSGYLMLARLLYIEGTRFSGAWNFGPRPGDEKPVSEVVAALAALWGDGAKYEIDSDAHPHEAGLLCLENARARTALGWSPQWDTEKALRETVRSYKAYYAQQDILDLCRAQIRGYCGGAS